MMRVRMHEDVSIRKMIKTDIEAISKGFIKQGWSGRNEVLRDYFDEQEAGERLVLVAILGEKVAGYITVLPLAKHGPFARRYPELADFNVFQEFQRQGIGSALLARAEQEVENYSPIVTLGVGLHQGYGAAQRLYIKQGYVPDGSGVWYVNQPLEMYADCNNNDNLILYLSKSIT